MSLRKRFKILELLKQKQKRKRDNQNDESNNNKQKIFPIRRTNLGTIFSLVAFLIAILPSTFQLIDSIRTFLNTLQETQKSLVLLVEGQSNTLNEVVLHQTQAATINVIDETSESKLNEILERLKQIEKIQLEFECCNNCLMGEEANLSNTNGEYAGDAEQDGLDLEEVCEIGPPPAETETIIIVAPQSRRPAIRPIFRLF